MVRASTVDDPEDAPCRAVGFSRHDLADESVEGDYPRLLLDAVEEFRAMYVPRGHVRPDAFPDVLVLDLQAAAVASHLRSMDTLQNLEPRLLVGGDGEFVIAQGLSVPYALVEIEYGRGRRSGSFGRSACLDGRGAFVEKRVARVYPALAPPGLQVVAVEDAPDRRGADRLDDAFGDGDVDDVRDEEARERLLILGRQLAGDGLDLCDLAGGKSSAASRSAGGL